MLYVQGKKVSGYGAKSQAVMMHRNWNNTYKFTWYGSSVKTHNICLPYSGTFELVGTNYECNDVYASYAGTTFKNATKPTKTFSGVAGQYIGLTGATIASETPGRYIEFKLTLVSVSVGYRGALIRL
jgi:hypothetical protein